MSEIDTKKLQVLKLYRINNGWVTETKEGDFMPKIEAHGDPLEVVRKCLEWLSTAGVKPKDRAQILGLLSGLNKDD